MIDQGFKEVSIHSLRIVRQRKRSFQRMTFVQSFHRRLVLLPLCFLLITMAGSIPLLGNRFNTTTNVTGMYVPDQTECTAPVISFHFCLRCVLSFPLLASILPRILRRCEIQTLRRRNWIFISMAQTPMTTEDSKSPTVTTYKFVTTKWISVSYCAVVK